MSNGLGALIAACCLAGLVAVANLSAETIPAGTPLEIRIQQPISSYSTPAGTKITGILISPVSEGGNILVPLGTTDRGRGGLSSPGWAGSCSRNRADRAAF